MAIEVTVPRLGWSMDEGTFAEWLKREGEWVGKGDMLFVLEGDKAVQEVESFDEGFLQFLPEGPSPGDIVRVGQVIGILFTKDENRSAVKDNSNDPALAKSADEDNEILAAAASWQSADNMRTEGSLSAEVSLGHRMGPAARRLARELKVDPANVTGSGPSGRILPEDIRDAMSRSPKKTKSHKPHASPRARRRADELGVDWSLIDGTGKSGRIRERDIVAAAASSNSSTLPRRSPETTIKSGRTKATPIRRTIAQRMVASHQTTAPVTLTTTVDATNLTGLRQQFKISAASADDVIPSYTDFIVKLVAFALDEHPMLNSRWDDDAITTFAEAHIGIAVDTEAGLLVPVIRDVQRLPLRTLAVKSKEMVTKAKQQRLASDEMQGGTFTVSNLGAFGIDAFTPIINGAQCAILGLGRIRKLPTYVADQLVPRDMMTLSLTFDHRIVDGGPAARFLQTLSQAIENPAARLID